MPGNESTFRPVNPTDPLQSHLFQERLSLFPTGAVMQPLMASFDLIWTLYRFLKHLLKCRQQSYCWISLFPSSLETGVRLLVLVLPVAKWAFESVRAVRAGLPVGDNYQQRSTLGRLARFPWGRREFRGGRYKSDLLNCFQARFHSKQCAWM